MPHNSNSLKDIFECKAQKLTTNSAAHSHLTSLGLLVWAVIAFGANDNVSERVTERERENEMGGQRDRQGVRENEQTLTLRMEDCALEDWTASLSRIEFNEETARMSVQYYFAIIAVVLF